MSNFDEFRRLTGLKSYLPTLQEARESVQYLDVGDVPPFTGGAERVRELALVEKAEKPDCGCGHDDKEEEDGDEDVEEGAFDRFIGGGKDKGTTKVSSEPRSAPVAQKPMHRTSGGSGPAVVGVPDRKPTKQPQPQPKRPLPKGKINPNGGFH